MSPVIQPGLGPRLVCLTPQEANATLFYQLAQFVVWSEAHTDVVAADPDLARLLHTASIALSTSGVLEYHTGSLPPNVINPVSDSETLASEVLSGGERDEN
jgi:hypothetical protein